MAYMSYNAWIRTAYDAWALGVEAAAVIGMRVAKHASGNDLDGAEARLMVTEKIESAWALPAEVIGLSPIEGTRTVLRHYRTKVTANRQRLSNGR